MLSMSKSTISMVIFNSYGSHYQRVSENIIRNWDVPHSYVR